jgi:hypothetical protein
VSVIMTEALHRWRSMRDEFELYRESAYQQAHVACKGVLLTKDAASAGVEAYSLFIGPEARALRYASEELRTWWETHPRVTVAQFEAAWTDDTYYGGGGVGI